MTLATPFPRPDDPPPPPPPPRRPEAPLALFRLARDHPNAEPALTLCLKEAARIGRADAALLSLEEPATKSDIPRTAAQ